ncbi:MFS transporter [Leisingera methylohalidivorans]|uniref:Major facilitator transporter n=1 Tax=Leisingera methylohalidivorans DSM 14336 TaxID=999552 RepID=V9VS72_9RHOB|nr:MFS transporter [Leisingera methylohalidivorans]AHC99706.1 major facilitator transporter [Leisingera methylohalidivorans DSM 14336]
MKRALIDNWALFLGMLLLMVGNGLLVTLLTIRGSTLGFTDLEISVMQSCYPLGALAGTMLTPLLIEKVGHIRVFSALASMVSVAAIAHLLTSDPVSWAAMRLLAGFCFPGLYVITESWLNAKSENRIRAQVLSVYFIIQTAGPALGTAMVGLPDPSGNLLFGVTSILLSVAIVPLLLSNIRAPDYSAPDRMPVTRLYIVSPMTVLGIVIMGAGVVAWYISLPLYALQNGFSEAQASGALVIALIAAALMQYPVGWLSDRTDRRYVVIALSGISALVALWMAVDTAPSRIVVGFSVIAATTLPIYSILAAHANDQLQPGQVVPASGTMAFLLQLGQFFGILIGPNMISLADGRGLQYLLIGVGVTVALIAIARRATSGAPEDTGEFQAMGVIGVAQPGVLQAESWAEEETSVSRGGREEYSSV